MIETEFDSKTGKLHYRLRHAATTMTRDEVACLIEAAVKDEREECAKACEALQVHKSPDYYPGQAFDGACRTCADANSQAL